MVKSRLTDRLPPLVSDNPSSSEADPPTQSQAPSLIGEVDLSEYEQGIIV